MGRRIGPDELRERNERARKKFAGKADVTAAEWLDAMGLPPGNDDADDADDPDVERVHEVLIFPKRGVVARRRRARRFSLRRLLGRLRRPGPGR